jgi:hypothetical protein
MIYQWLEFCTGTTVLTFVRWKDINVYKVKKFIMRTNISKPGSVLWISQQHKRYGSSCYPHFHKTSNKGSYFVTLNDHHWCALARGDSCYVTQGTDLHICFCHSQVQEMQSQKQIKYSMGLAWGGGAFLGTGDSRYATEVDGHYHCPYGLDTLS